MRQVSAHVAAAALGLGIVTAAPALCAACPSVARGSLSEPGARLSGQWLYDAQLRDARRAKTWRYAWTGINAGFAVGQFGLMPFVDRDRRIEFAVGGVYATVSAVFTWFVPLEVESTLDRRTNAVSLCEGLRLEENFAATAAADEAGRVTWPWHALNVGAGALYFAIMGFATGQWVNGAVDGVLTFAVGEAQLFTQPTRLARQWEAYEQAGSAPRHAFLVIPDRAQGTLVFTFATTF
jgi:hypothetical protein